MKILVTGFEPFGGDAVNPSAMAVGLLPEQIDEADIIKKVLPVVFGEAADQLTEMIREELPDAVICTGLAAGREGITPEQVAVNMRHARIPDNAGAQPEQEKILPDGEEGLFSTLPVREMVQAMNDAGIHAEISETAGTYVCNEVMYRLLDCCRKEFPDMKAGFIHLPCALDHLESAAQCLPEGTDVTAVPVSENGNAMPIEEIVQALKICVRETASKIKEDNPPVIRVR